jgi:hypothetical protein
MQKKQKKSRHIKNDLISGARNAGETVLAAAGMAGTTVLDKICETLHVGPRVSNPASHETRTEVVTAGNKYEAMLNFSKKLISDGFSTAGIGSPESAKVQLWKYYYSESRQVHIRVIDAHQVPDTKNQYNVEYVVEKTGVKAPDGSDFETEAAVWSPEHTKTKW